MSAPRAVPIGSAAAQAAWRWHALQLPFVPGRVRASVARWMLAGYGQPITVVLPNGLAMRLDLRDHVQCHIAVTGEWEGAIFDACALFVDAGSTVLDVGAHVGYAALRLAAMTGPAGRVVAVEPVPAHQRAVEAQFALNGLAASLTIVNAAASDRLGEASFDSGIGSNAGTGRLAAHGALTVPTLRLDDWLDAAGITGVSLAKIDIEGAEGLALAGLERTLGAARIGALLIELHPTELPRFGSSVAQVVAQLTAHRYRVRYWEQPGAFRDGPPSADVTYLLAIAPGASWPEERRP